MSNIDKQALREAAERADSISWDGIEYELDVGPRATEFISCCSPATVLALLDELEAKDRQIDDLKATAAHSNAGWKEAHEQEARAEAAEKRIAVLTESLKQTISGYKSCLRMGYDRILDLGGDCDSPEVMITGNPDIQQAEKLLAAAAGKGE